MWSQKYKDITASASIAATLKNPDWDEKFPDTVLVIRLGYSPHVARRVDRFTLLWVGIQRLEGSLRRLRDQTDVEAFHARREHMARVGEEAYGDGFVGVSTICIVAGEGRSGGMTKVCSSSYTKEDIQKVKESAQGRHSESWADDLGVALGRSSGSPVPVMLL